MRLVLTPDERALILSRREDAKRKADAAIALKQQLYNALDLPFDDAYHVVKQFCNAEFKLVFDPRVIEWCRKHSKAILAKHNSGE